MRENDVLVIPNGVWEIENGVLVSANVVWEIVNAVWEIVNGAWVIGISVAEGSDFSGDEDFGIEGETVGVCSESPRTA